MVSRHISTLDQKLLRLLEVNARASVADLARELDVTRATVQSHINHLQHQGVIKAFTVTLSNEYKGAMVEAHVWISTEQKKVSRICKLIENMPDSRSLYSISGEFDLVAILKSPSTEALDRAIDNISELDGVLRTQTSVVLSTKFER